MKNHASMEIDFLDISQAQLKRWARLTDAKVRQEEGIFIAEGIKVIEELFVSDWQTKAILVLPEKNKNLEKLLQRTKQDIPIYQLSRSQWQKLGQDREPEGIMAVVSIKQQYPLSAWYAETPGNVLILHEINNPRNLGALMRSAYWFGFRSIILSSNSADYTNPKAVRASMGSLFHLTIITDVDLSKALPEIKKNYRLVGSHVREGSFPHAAGEKVALLLGNESHGLPEALLKMADEQWSIPGNSEADSLSLPQAAAIMMYEAVKKPRV
jgi:TrmH family RNA methyltransferase